MSQNKQTKGSLHKGCLGEVSAVGRAPERESTGGWLSGASVLDKTPEGGGIGGSSFEASLPGTAPEDEGNKCLWNKPTNL